VISCNALHIATYVGSIRSKIARSFMLSRGSFSTGDGILISHCYAGLHYETYDAVSYHDHTRPSI